MRKTTNPYRRVASVSYRTAGKVNSKNVKLSSTKCLSCMVTLVKSSKDKQRSGVKLRCQCNVRVCVTCFKNNNEWHMTMPHFFKCPTVQSFICAACACFEGIREKVCCVWMCPRCSGYHWSKEGVCSVCASSLANLGRRETCALWCESNGLGVPEDRRDLAYDEEKIADYRDLVKPACLTGSRGADICRLRISGPCLVNVSTLSCARAR